MKETLTREKLTFEVFYPHAPERVWRALTDPSALQRWLMPTDFRARLGRKFRFAEPTDDRFDQPIHCEVVELDAPRRLAYTWQSEHDAEPTLVTWTLEPVEGGTRVHLEHAAPALASNLAFHSEAESNWITALRNSLPASLDRPTVRIMGRIDLSTTAANARCIRRRSRLQCGSVEPRPSSERLVSTQHPTPNTRVPLSCKEQTHVSHR